MITLVCLLEEPSAEEMLKAVLLNSTVYTHNSLIYKET